MSTDNTVAHNVADSLADSLIGIALTATGWVALVIIGAVGLAGYWLSCRSWPYTACPHCDSIGRVKSANGKHWRTCHRCNGTGQRRRLGAHLTGTGGSHHDRSRDRYRDGGNR